MSSNIVLNRSNILNSGNNKLLYEFPGKITFEEGDQLAISHMNIYYSWYNISSRYNNNYFQYKWWDANGDLTSIHGITIPDGFYSANTLYEYFQKVMVQNNHYLLTDPSIGGDYVYFIEILTNITYYSIEIRLSSLCEEYVTNNNLLYPANAGWIAPPNTLDGNGEVVTHYATPQIIIPSNNNFGELVGFNANAIYQDTDVQGQYSFLNDFAANMNPSSSFIITCSLIDNTLGSPNNILYAFTIPNNVSFGDLITSNTDVIYSKIKPGSYSNLRLEIQDEQFRPLQIIDPTMLIVLSILKNSK